MTIAYLSVEFFIDTGEYPVFMAIPEINIFFIFLLILLVAFEVIIAALQQIAASMMTPEKQKQLEDKKLLARQNNFWKKKLSWLLGKEPKEESELLIEDHNYDGIRELDNALPPWWRYLFYGTIVFGAFYMIRYHLLDAPSQMEEFEQQMIVAAEEIEAYKAIAKDFVDASNVVVLTESSDLETGKALYTTNCAVCHRNDGGGGIGPNLADIYWISGGDIASIFETISNGGRPGKGMISWKNTLKPSEIQQVSSYLLTFQNTEPLNGKAPEGDPFRLDPTEE
jgi:cytochrome c oxidase cbb3-type subunit 3